MEPPVEIDPLVAMWNSASYVYIYINEKRKQQILKYCLFRIFGFYVFYKNKHHIYFK